MSRAIYIIYLVDTHNNISKVTARDSTVWGLRIIIIMISKITGSPTLIPYKNTRSIQSSQKKKKDRNNGGRSSEEALCCDSAAAGCHFRQQWPDHMQGVSFRANGMQASGDSSKSGAAVGQLLLCALKCRPPVPLLLQELQPLAFPWNWSNPCHAAPWKVQASSCCPLLIDSQANLLPPKLS